MLESIRPTEPEPDVLVGLEPGDDAGVLRIPDGYCLVQTADFITPVVDDPYLYGRIAAANSISDIYAMGARPVSALNLVCFDNCNLDVDDLRQILAGGLDTIRQSGARLLGGHSVEAPEMKYGLAVTGLVKEDAIIRNTGAMPGDSLVLTKPLGIGIVTTALKADMAPAEAIAAATEQMLELNRDAAAWMVKLGAHGATDITGFGLIGHALEMTAKGNISFRFSLKDIPYLPASMDLASMGLIPGGAYANRSHCEAHVDFPPGTSEDFQMVCYDAQTSGGLLIALSPDAAETLVRELHSLGNQWARVIGNVIPRDEKPIRFV